MLGRGCGVWTVCHYSAGLLYDIRQWCGVMTELLFSVNFKKALVYKGPSAGFQHEKN